MGFILLMLKSDEFRLLTCHFRPTFEKAPTVKNARISDDFIEGRLRIIEIGFLDLTERPLEHTDVRLRHIGMHSNKCEVRSTEQSLAIYKRRSGA